MCKIYELFLATILKNNLITDSQYQNILSLLNDNTDFEFALHQEVPNFSTDYIYDILGELYRRQRITINEITENFVINLKKLLMKSLVLVSEKNLNHHSMNAIFLDVKGKVIGVGIM